MKRINIVCITLLMILLGVNTSCADYLGIFSKCLKIIKMVCVTSYLGLPYTYHFWYSYPFPSLKGMSFQRIRFRLPFISIL